MGMTIYPLIIDDRADEPPEGYGRIGFARSMRRPHGESQLNQAVHDLAVELAAARIEIGRLERDLARALAHGGGI